MPLALASPRERRTVASSVRGVCARGAPWQRTVTTTASAAKPSRHRPAGAEASCLPHAAFASAARAVGEGVVPGPGHEGGGDREAAGLDPEPGAHRGPDSASSERPPDSSDGREEARPWESWRAHAAF